MAFNSHNCYWNRDERYYKAGSWKGKQDLDGGTLFTQDAAHFIDIMYWLFGDLKDIQAKNLMIIRIQSLPNLKTVVW